MDYKTLHETRDILKSDLPAFICIGRPKRSPCDQTLESERKLTALNLLTDDNTPLTLKDQWDILTLLLCATCQNKFNQRNKIKDHWGLDTAETNPTGKRYRSPYSLHSRSPESHRRRSSALRLAVNGECSTPRGRSSERRTSASPSEAALVRRRERHEALQRAGPAQMDDGDITVADFEMEDGSHINVNPPAEPAPSPPSTNSMQYRRGHAFSVGESSTWAPWKLRNEVLKLLWEPLPGPKSKGTIYAVEVIGTSYVKIGITTRKVSTRLDEIEKTHGVKLRIGSERSQDNIPLLQLYRLERLVHMGLAFSQRHLTVQKTTTSLTHNEYFEVDLATAFETIQMFLKIMRSIGLEPGNQIDTTIIESVQDAMRNIDDPPEGTSIYDHEWWQTINADHERNRNILSSAFNIPHGGHKKSRVDSTISSLTISALALCVLYSSRLPNWVKDISTIFLFIAGALYSMDTRSSYECIAWVVNTFKTMPCFMSSLKGRGRSTV